MAATVGAAPVFTSGKKGAGRDGALQGFAHVTDREHRFVEAKVRESHVC
jgi:hypothetical protein